MTLALNHIRRGSGPPLVLVHGIGSQHQVWSPVLDALAAQRDVIALDLPGFGASPPLPAGTAPTVEALCDAVASFAAELGLERPHVAGNSLGGGIALALAYTGRACSATALSPIGFWNDAEARYARRSLRALRASARASLPVVDTLYATRGARAVGMWQVAARGWRLSREEAAGSLRALAGAPGFDATLEAIVGEGPSTPWMAPAGDFPVPVTVAWGQRDRLLIPRQARRAARRLPGARHVLMTGVGHVPFWDDPDQVAGVVLEGSAAG